MLGAGIVEVINAVNFGEHVVTEIGIVTKESADGLNMFTGDNDGDHVAEFADEKHHVGELGFEGGQRGMIDGSMRHGSDC